MSARSATELRCRPIEDADLDVVVGLLREGFDDRSEAYWRRGLARHAGRDLPAGHPRWGYLLVVGREAVGVLLTLHAPVAVAGTPLVRCNLSSWYVRPAYRSHASLLEKIAARQPEVTYINVTPAPSTWPILELRGYRRYCRGQMLAVPVLGRPRRGARAREVAADDPLPELPAAERALVRDHLGYGCLALLCADREGAVPLIFQRRTIGPRADPARYGRIPCLQLVYCRDTGDVARFAAAVGRRLLRLTGRVLVVIDAVGPLPGLVGRYFEDRAVKYGRGPAVADALGDLSYTELVIFGP